jgi:phytoene dehydrogenase-like protein
MHEVSEAWEVLERAGVPFGHGGPSRPELEDVGAVVRAVREVLARPESLSPRQRVSLLAWLRAWASSFPTSFRGAFAQEAESVLTQAADGVDDTNRYLKLRRIARDKLSRVL